MAKVLFVNPLMRERTTRAMCPYGMPSSPPSWWARASDAGVRPQRLAPLDAVIAPGAAGGPLDVVALGASPRLPIDQADRGDGQELAPQALVVAGGGFPRACHEIMRFLPRIDVGVVGEAFVSFPELLAAWTRATATGRRCRG